MKTLQHITPTQIITTMNLNPKLISLLFAATLTTMMPASAGPVVLIPGTADPYLAGLPDGAMASFGDIAPDQSPVLVPGTLPAAGSSITFTNVTGSVSNSGFVPSDPPDGDLTSFLQHFANAPGTSPAPENGIADLVAPLNSLVGLFLDDADPSLTLAPTGLDFSGSGNIDFTQISGLDFLMLSPFLKQPFFIGDGLTSSNVIQQFVVPAGATRLYLGSFDGYGWYNNSGLFSVEVNNVAAPEPSAAL